MNYQHNERILHVFISSSFNQKKMKHIYKNNLIYNNIVDQQKFHLSNEMSKTMRNVGVAQLAQLSTCIHPKMKTFCLFFSTYFQ